MNRFQKYLVKIKGDAGIYNVYTIDYLNYRLFISRTCMSEWISIDKIKEIIPVDKFI